MPQRASLPNSARRAKRRVVLPLGPRVQRARAAATDSGEVRL